MTTTTFTTKETVIEAAWANDVNALVYDVFNGATTVALARTALGLVIGTNVQAWDADLDAIAALAKTDSNIIVGNGSTWVAESGATARTSLGLGTGDSPQFTGIEVGHATDSTLTRTSAGILAVEGNELYRAGGTDVPLTDGGTGASSKGAAQTALGIIPDDGAWADYTPTISAASGTITTASGTGRWLQQGKVVHLSVTVTITTNGTGASAVRFSLPVNLINSSTVYFFAGRSDVSGVIHYARLKGDFNLTNGYIYDSSGLYPGGNGAIMEVSGS